MSTGINALNNKLSINLGATFDPYALDENNRRINEFNIKEGGGFFRMSSANMNMNYTLSSKMFEKKKKNNTIDKEENDTETASSGGRDDGLFGRAVNYRDNSLYENNDKEASKYPFYQSKIPWDLKLAHSLTYSNNQNQKDISNNSLMFSSNVELTPKWRINVSSGYDFKRKGFTYTTFGFDRDLRSWVMNFNWVPFSNRASWNFFIGIKSSLLRDIKYEKNREPDRRLN
tara:strand:- start:801 stop:1490 length:690 start_codon:yes stop_codon:yes gene_type:complete